MTSDKQPRPGVPVPPESLTKTWAHRNTTSVHEDLVDAAAWGADEQLRLCLEWLRCELMEPLTDELHAAMRPKPPSLKELAITELIDLVQNARGHGVNVTADTIRRALEALPDDEGTP
jgi:hypothetical protein